MFARRTGQSLREVMEMHPRDFATWEAEDLRDALRAEQERGIQRAHEEHAAGM